MTRTGRRADRTGPRRAGADTPAVSGTVSGEPAVTEGATALRPGLRTCLEQELENLWRLLRYRGLERRFADEARSVDEAVRAALEEGSQALSLSALRRISALTAAVNRETSTRADPRQHYAARA